MENKNKATVTESIEWESPEKGVLKYKKETLMHDDKGNLVGKHVVEQDQLVLYEELSDNVELRKGTVQNLENQLKQKKKDFEQIGKVVMTGEIAKLKKNLEVLNKVIKREQLENQIKNDEKNLADANDDLAKREETLKGRPTE